MGDKLKIALDKLYHGVVCFFATSIVAGAMFFLGKTGAILCGVWFALGLGFGKEYGDHKASGNKWDWLDIVADVVGIGLSVFLFVKLWKI